MGENNIKTFWGTYLFILQSKQISIWMPRQKYWIYYNKVYIFIYITLQYNSCTVSIPNSFVSMLTIGIYKNKKNCSLKITLEIPIIGIIVLGIYVHTTATHKHFHVQTTHKYLPIISTVSIPNSFVSMLTIGIYQK